jgi:hypothetical protein
MLGKTANKQRVDDTPSSFYQKSLEPIIKDVLSKIQPDDRKFIFDEIDMGTIIGNSICVETTDKDDIFYAQRNDRKGLTRFVRNRESVPCSTVVVILKQARAHGNNSYYFIYKLVTAWIGSKTPAEPWDHKATSESVQFWNTHALIVDGTYEIVPGTETTKCPW